MTSGTVSTSGRTAWARNLAAPVRNFLQAETAGAVALVLAVAVALVWANVPGWHSYENVWTTKLAVTLGSHGIENDLRGWVNQGLMTLFFLVVGLETKRELDLGELRERTRLGIPAVSALGGMVAALAIYLAFNAGGPGAHGWGTAMSTDTALALGALALAAPTGSTRLRVFLLTLSVVDDLGALVVITVAYSGHVAFGWLGIAIAMFGVLVLLRYAGSWRGPFAVMAAFAIWLALFKSGVDPVVAGLAIGLVTSAYPPSREDLQRATELAREFREQPTPELAYSAQRGLTAALSANDRLQFRLHPWTSFVIVPLFALANAGIHLDGTLLRDAVTSPITLGIVVAYCVGKPLGITGAAWIGTRKMFGRPRLTVTWPGLFGTGAVAGMGFTASILIANLAFHGEALEEAKLGVLASIVISTLIACGIFQGIKHLPDAVRLRQLGRTAATLIDLAEDVDPERDHIRGKHDAPVTLVEYGDFECPFCGNAEPIVRELLAENDASLRYVWRHLPLTDVHPHAQLAAEASEAAAVQGRFWEMHDQLLEHQGALEIEDLQHYARELELEVDQFTEDVMKRRFAPHVAEDVTSADASGVSGTPTFFINGRRHQGVYDVATLTAQVQAARIARLGHAAVKRADEERAGRR